MSCPWNEEQAYSFAEGSLEPGSARSFAAHLDGCSACRERVTEARRLDSLLRYSITLVPAPPTLASRIADAVVMERETRRGFAWPWRLSPLSLSPAVVGLIAVLGLALAATLISPGSVMAVVQRALVFIPGFGISAVDQENLVATGPVSVRDGAVTFTVDALLSQGEGTTVKFTVTGLPGGKEGWDEGRAAGAKPRPAEEAGQSQVGPPRSKRVPYLREETGREYRITSSQHGVGGTAEESKVEGELFFPPLPGDLRSIELVMPWDHLVPETVLPGATTKEWVVRIPLAPPTQSGLPQATPQGAASTVHGVTLRVAASTVEPDRTVVLLDGQAEGEARPLFVGKNGGNLAEELVLKDAQGRSYRWMGPQSTAVMGDRPFQETLYFDPLAPGARQLTLTVKSLRVQEKGSAEFALSLAGLQPGQSLALNRTLTLAGRDVLLKSARVAQEGDGRWLYVDVDLGPTADGFTMSSFGVQAGGAPSMSSKGFTGGGQMDFFGVRLEPGQEQVKLTLSDPMVNVGGPWELSFGVNPK